MDEYMPWVRALELRGWPPRLLAWGSVVLGCPCASWRWDAQRRLEAALRERSPAGPPRLPFVGLLARRLGRRTDEDVPLTVVGGATEFGISLVQPYL